MGFKFRWGADFRGSSASLRAFSGRVAPPRATTFRGSPLSTRSRHLSSHHHTWTNVCIRATARRPRTTAMGAIRPLDLLTFELFICNDRFALGLALASGTSSAVLLW